MKTAEARGEEAGGRMSLGEMTEIWSQKETFLRGREEEGRARRRRNSDQLRCSYNSQMRRSRNHWGTSEAGIKGHADRELAVIFVDEDDVGTYTIKSIDDPRALNKTIYLRPRDNCLTQNELIAKWEELTGKCLEKIPISGDDFLASMKDMDYATQVGVGHFYHIFFEGCLTNFNIGDNCAEATLLYPEVQYTRMDEYLKRYL
ncbi:hypothetical protein GUJ93_ZPchr0009g986 [Zizania palustris]|uniref:NmrA-like domain-containing protein n=1 Tax=Zizania palustris TaxID=103762 RepID=A0A8J5RLQ2_ZIZPA|nr:hypothetical protein GUJ93_ZPchr0009g986 [Zizania palustris]